MPKILNRVGEKHITNEGYEIEIIEYFGAFNCTIQFKNGCIKDNVDYKTIKKGEIKNPYHKSFLGVGLFGQGDYKARVQNKSTIYYARWKNMLERCYNKKYQEMKPTYKDCSVDEKWHNFQVFAEWFEEKYKEGFELDKDILVKGNKIYSPETCCFVPKEINLLLVKCNSSRGNYPIGVSKEGTKYRVRFGKNDKRGGLGSFNTPEEAFEVYKTEKEKYIKEVAEKYKNQITEQTHQALINYKVEITD